MEIRLLEGLIFRFIRLVEAFRLFRREFFHLRHKFQVVRGQMPGDGHLLFMRRPTSRGVVVKEGWWLGDCDIFVEVQFLWTGAPVPVRRLVMIHEEEGPVGISFVFQKVQDQVSDNVRGVAFMNHPALRSLHRRVVVRSLSEQDLPVIKTGRIAAQVPFADDRRLVAGLLEQFGHCLLRPVEKTIIRGISIEMAVFAGENHRSGRSTDGVRHKTVPKQHSLFRKPIQIRRLIDAIAVATQRLVGMVICHDKENVGTLRLCLLGGFLCEYRPGKPAQRRTDDPNGTENTRHAHNDLPTTCL